MSTTTETQVRIKAKFGYYANTYNAPKDGYLCDEHGAPLEFDSIKSAYAHLTNSDCYDQNAMFCEYDGDGNFSVSGPYECAHGQHSRPVYTVVSRKSGRCTKGIISECDALDGALD